MHFLDDHTGTQRARAAITDLSLGEAERELRRRDAGDVGCDD
jgi:hypothetical protein